MGRNSDAAIKLNDCNSVIYTFYIQYGTLLYIIILIL